MVCHQEIQQWCQHSGVQSLSLVCHGTAAWQCLRLDRTALQDLTTVAAPLTGSPLANSAQDGALMKRLLPDWHADGGRYAIVSGITVNNKRSCWFGCADLYVELLDCWSNVCQTIGQTSAQTKVAPPVRLPCLLLLCRFLPPTHPSTPSPSLSFSSLW